MAAAAADVRAFFSPMPVEKTPMNHDDALRQLSHIARERAFGKHVGSDRLVQAGLNALIAGVESPSLADREKSLPRRLSQKYLGEDPPAEPDEVLRLIVRVTPQKITGFAV